LIIEPIADDGNNVWVNLSENADLLFTLVELTLDHKSSFDFLFSTSFYLNIITLTNCDIKSESIIKGIAYVEGGSFIAYNCYFYNLNFSDYGIFFDNGSSPNTKHIFNNCKFESISTSGSFPILFDISFRMIINLTNNTFSNINTTCVESVAALIKLTIFYNPNISLLNNLFENVNSTKSCIVLNLTTNYTLSDTVFDKIVSHNSNGAAIFLSTVSSSIWFSIIKCYFINCSVLDEYCGGFYFAFILFLFFIFFE
jgi:hypothetical protein